MARRSRYALGLLLIPALLMLPTSGDGPDRAEAEVARPERPLPPDMIEGFGDGRVLAFQYHLSYYCPTMPGSDLDGPFGHGDGHAQADDPLEYQTQSCFVGDSGGKLKPELLQFADSPATKTLYGIVPNFGGSAVHTNTPGTDVQTQCSQPGLPYTQVKGTGGSCLMHPMTYRVFPGVGSPPFPDPTVGAQHSHIIEGTSHPASWWNAVIVLVTDPSIWPDLDGKCPAGPPACLTSVEALRAAQDSGQASGNYPTNLYFFYSVAPVTNVG